MNPNMATTPNDYALRAITLGSSILGFPLIVGGTVVSIKAHNDGWGWHSSSFRAGPIVFAFIPLTFSIVLSTICLIRARKQRESSSRGQAIKLLADFGLMLSYLGVLIPFYVIEPRRLNRRANWMLLEAYASFFLVANMLFHFYLVCRYLRVSLSGLKDLFSSFCVRECPHCHKQLAGTGPQMSGGRLGREGYSLLHAEDYLDEDAVAFEGADAPDARKSTDSGKSSMDV